MSLSAEERKILSQAKDIITRELAGGQPVQIQGFGKFIVKEMKLGKTQQQMSGGLKKTAKVIRFKVSQVLKDAVKANTKVTG